MSCLTFGRTCSRSTELMQAWFCARLIAAFNVEAADIIAKGLVDPGFEFGEGDAVEHGLGVADLEDGFYCAVKLAPGAVVVVFDVFYDAGLDGVLVDVAQEGGEIGHVVLASLR